VGFGLTRQGPSDIRASRVPAARGGDEVLAESLDLLARRDIARFGHLVAPMGVRFVAVVDRAGPDGGTPTPVDTGLLDGLATQLDLTAVEAEPGMLLYENTAWAPARSLVAGERAAAVPSGDDVDPIAAGLRTELGLLAQPVTGPLTESQPVAPGALLLAENADGRWEAQQGGEPLERSTTFGWANGFEALDAGSARLSARSSAAARMLFLLQALAWIAVVVAWWRSRSRRARLAPEAAPQDPEPVGIPAAVGR